MLRLIRNPHPGGGDDAHERAFLLRHDSLLGCARRLVGQDVARADDLLQDAFLQFTLARPDLAVIENLDGYLIRLLRNLHLSALRHGARRERRLIAVPDFDSVAIALDGLDAEQRLQARGDLHLVCRYVRVRKTQSKAASVLALRFFLGFSPTEAAALLRATTAVVHRWLWQARAEARQFLASPPLDRQARLEAPSATSAVEEGDPEAILEALRAELRAANDSSCPAPAVLRAIYVPDANGRSVSTACLAHLVSCERCLATATTLLNLPHPGRNDPPDGSGGSRRQRDVSLGARTRARRRDIQQHRPKALRVFVNGVHVGELAVESTHSRVRWTLRADEPVAFIEARSEQGLRMAWLNVTPAPDGDITQAIEVALSEGRTLSLAIDFTQLPSSIALEYIDRSYGYEQAAADDVEATALDEAVPRNEGAAPTARWRLRGWLREPRLAFASLVLVAGLSLLWAVVGSRPSIPPAAVLLEQAAGAVPAPAPGRVHHQALRFDVRSAAAAAARRYVVDVWTAAGRRAVRVSDDAGHLVGGRWQQSDGSLQTLPLGLFDEIWSAGLSAASFSARYGGPDAQCRAAGDEVRLRVTCERATRRSSTAPAWLEVLVPTVFAQDDGAASAELILRRADLRPVGMRVIFGSGTNASQVSLDEERFRELPADAAPAGTFSGPAAPTPPVPAVAPSAASPTTRVPDTSLEIRVAELLDRLQGDDQLTVTWADRRRLRVAGLVASDARRREVLAALERLSADGALAIDIATHDDLRTTATRARAADGATRVEVRELPSGAPAIAPYFTARMNAQQAADVLRELSPRVVSEARTARLHVARLATLIDAYPETVVGELTPEGRTAWRALLTRRVALTAKALETLDRLLAPHFENDASEGPPAWSSIADATHRLAHDASVIESAIAAAFTARPRGAPAIEAAVPTDFRKHLERALADARFIDSRLQQEGVPR